jgi:hypothetical protein
MREIAVVTMPSVPTISALNAIAEPALSKLASMTKEGLAVCGKVSEPEVDEGNESGDEAPEFPIGLIVALQGSTKA